MKLFLLTFTLTIGVVYGTWSDVQVVENYCFFADAWSIRLEPESLANLTGVPYIQGQRDVEGCGVNQTYTNTDGYAEYQFVLNTTAVECGMTRGDPPNIYTYTVVIVFPIREDGVETQGDHILTAQCTVPAPQYLYNQTLGIIEPSFTDYSPNKTDIVSVTPPNIRIRAFRANLELTPGSTVFLGESLDIKVDVNDSGANVYTKVKVDKFWATYENNPGAEKKLVLIENGCATESTVMNKFTSDNDTREIGSTLTVFRFSNQQTLYLWVNVIACAYTDVVTCEKCSSERRRKRAAISPYSSLTPLAGLRRFKLVVLNPAPVDPSYNAEIELEPATVPVLREPSPFSAAVCLTVTQTTTVCLVGLLIVSITIIVAVVIFIKLRSVSRRETSAINLINRFNESTESLSRSTASC